VISFFYKTPKWWHLSSLGSVTFIVHSDKHWCISGTHHEYSNFGYLVLGMVIEEITGIRYEDYVRSVLRDIGVEDIHIGSTTQDKVHHMEVSNKH
jgi:N-acyl-D-amino-acid deacylase